MQSLKLNLSATVLTLGLKAKIVDNFKTLLSESFGGELRTRAAFDRCVAHTAVKRGARAQFPPKLSLKKVLNFRKFPLSSLKLRQSLKS